LRRFTKVPVHWAYGFCSIREKNKRRAMLQEMKINVGKLKRSHGGRDRWPGGATDGVRVLDFQRVRDYKERKGHREERRTRGGGRKVTTRTQNRSCSFYAEKQRYGGQYGAKTGGRNDDSAHPENVRKRRKKKEGGRSKTVDSNGRISALAIEKIGGRRSTETIRCKKLFATIWRRNRESTAVLMFNKELSVGEFGNRPPKEKEARRGLRREGIEF